MHDISQKIIIKQVVRSKHMASDPKQYLGIAPLFIGIESANWNLTQFRQATTLAKSIGITSVLVKIADGANIWYGNLGGWQKVLATIKLAGLPAIPYSYSYGNTYGALSPEINILIAAMRQNGVVIADMELEYNGQITWAQQVCNALKPVPGAFGVTTWADPQLQNWNGVLATLKPCVNFWLPQVYTSFLSSFYHAQFDQYGLPYYPVLDLSSRDNNLSIAATANSPIIAFWEYQQLSTNSTLIKTIINTLTRR